MTVNQQSLRHFGVLYIASPHSEARTFRLPSDSEVPSESVLVLKYLPWTWGYFACLKASNCPRTVKSAVVNSLLGGRRTYASGRHHLCGRLEWSSTKRKAVFWRFRVMTCDWLILLRFVGHSTWRMMESILSSSEKCTIITFSWTCCNFRVGKVGTG